MARPHGPDRRQQRHRATPVGIRKRTRGKSHQYQDRRPTGMAEARWRLEVAGTCRHQARRGVIWLRQFGRVRQPASRNGRYRHGRYAVEARSLMADVRRLRAVQAELSEVGGSGATDLSGSSTGKSKLSRHGIPVLQGLGRRSDSPGLTGGAGHLRIRGVQRPKGLNLTQKSVDDIIGLTARDKTSANRCERTFVTTTGNDDVAPK